MKYFLIAGERSGDMYGGELIASILAKDKNAEIQFFGGDMMQEAGGKLLDHYKDAAFMGFLEVVKNLGKIRKRLDKCKKAIKEFNPDVVVFIDYPGFNLRIAKYTKTLGIKTAYYISPKIWAWKKGRIKQIRKYVDRMLVIFPFEVAFYNSLDYKVKYVGNPLVEMLSKSKASSNGIEKEDKIAFLPGSRVQEINSSIETIIELAKQRPDLTWVVAGVDNVNKEIYAPLETIVNVEVHIDKTHEVLRRSSAAVITSGTATLETALLGVPQVVCYRTSAITYWIAKRFVKIKFISLVNLIADKLVVKELIQDEYNPRAVLAELDMLLNNISYRRSMLDGYAEVKTLLGEHATSDEVADHVISLAS